MVHPLLEISSFVSSHSNVCVVFDLDSTLFNVSSRTQAILRDLSSSAEFRSRFSAAAEFLSSCEVLPSDWGVRSVMKRSGLVVEESLVSAVRSFWREHFFSNTYLDRDVLYPSAREYVSYLASLGASIFYLTGRSDRGMRAGTEAALLRFGFPFSAGSLYMKPDEVETDEHFKVKELESLGRRFSHIVFFENEPVIISQVRARLPSVRIVFVNSTHSGRENSPSDLLTIGMDYSAGLKP